MQLNLIEHKKNTVKKKKKNSGNDIDLLKP